MPNDSLTELAKVIAQGPMLGNVALADFDRTMSSGDVRCLRYVDDFLILGPSERAVRCAFDVGRAFLGKLGLEAYDLGSPKAAAGHTDQPFTFLGCSVMRGLARPSRDSTHRLGEKVDARLAMFQARPKRSSESLGHVLADVSSIVHGWRKSFDFCEQDFVFKDPQELVERKLEVFFSSVMRRYGACESTNERGALLGLRPMRSGPSG